MNYINKYSLELAIFLCGAVVMILEMVGSRIMSPYVGSSIFVWTSLIGIILGSLSLGYWWGGKIADKNPNYKTFSLIILLSALAVIIITLLKGVILSFLTQIIQDIRFSSVISATLLFAPASILLGMISPYAVKLKLHNLNTSGTAVGQLYAISTLGSIFGTFLSGFFLISYFGNTAITNLLAVLLWLISILVAPKDLKTEKIITIIFIGLVIFSSYATQKHLIALGTIDVDTNYSRVLIAKGTDQASKRPVLYLLNNPHEAQSAMFLDQDDELVFDYTKFYRLDEHFYPNFKKALIIGGGAYSYPKDFLKKYPDKTLDVVEIGPKFTELAKKYFNLTDNHRLAIYHEDGRTYLNRNQKKYDVIYLDAFRSFYSIPYNMTTKEAMTAVEKSLSDNGVVLLNVISSLAGNKSQFLNAEINTMKQIFPQVYALQVKNQTAPEDPQNIMIVALKTKKLPEWQNENKEINSYLKNLWTKEFPNNLPVLTDDYAPVDQYIMKLM